MDFKTECVRLRERWLADGEAHYRERHLKARSSEERAKLEQTREELASFRKEMSPPGTFNIPLELESRRWEYLIPDAAFRGEALFERILVWQIDLTQEETFGGTSIIRPDAVRDYDKESAARGILLSMGLASRDAFLRNGTQLGDIVNFIRNAVFRLPIGYVGAREHRVIPLQAGDLVRNETLHERLASGATRLVQRKGDNGAIEHIYVNDGDEPSARLDVLIPEQY